MLISLKDKIETWIFILKSRILLWHKRRKIRSAFGTPPRMVLKDLQPSFSLSISNYPSLQPQRFWLLAAIPLVIYLIPWSSFSLPQIIQQGQTFKTALPQKNGNPLNLDSIRAKKNTADSIKKASVKQSVFFKTGVLADKTKKNILPHRTKKQ
jgi:hypothetical protein